MTWIRAVAAALAVLVLTWAVVRPEQMVVEQVVFEGNGHATDAQLRHLADVRNGVLLWQVDLGAVANGVQRHPWVAAAEVERSFPHSLVVRVTEREPVALLAFGDALFYVDASGAPFLEADSSALDFPIVTGVGPALEKRNGELPRQVVADALWILDQLDGRTLLPRARVSQIDFHPTRGFAVHTSGALPGHGAAEVLFGLGDYERQLVRLEALIDEAGLDLSRPLHVDLAPQRVAIVRPKDPPSSRGFRDL